MFRINCIEGSASVDHSPRPRAALVGGKPASTSNGACLSGSGPLLRVINSKHIR